MSKSSSLRTMFRGVAVAGLVAVSSAWSHAAIDFPILGDFPPEGASRLATFDASTGETSFALSLTPQFKQGGTLPSDVVIYVDTSASQTGLYKRDSLELVQQLLENLNAEDRVKVVAVDIDSVVLTPSFVAPGVSDLEAALKQLQDRVPLGSTDFVGMLESSNSLFEAKVAGRNQSIIYIGDGLSRGGLLNDRKFNSIVAQLADAEVSFSSFAIGPERDVESLAALSNQLGGNVIVDSDEANAIDNAATALADTVHGLIFWPSDAKFSEAVAEVLPQQFPPLRADRDSILIGSLTTREPVTISVTGKVNGTEQSMAWTVAAENSSEDFAFLPKLIDSARDNGGMTLPTIGSAGLREAARLMSDGSRNLSQLGSSALISGNFTAARKFAEEALAIDPSNGVAAALKEAAANASTSGLSLPETQEPAPQEPAPQEPAPQEPVFEESTPAAPSGSSQGALQLIGPGAQDNEIQDLIRDNQPQVEDLAGQETDRQRVLEERAKAQVRFTLGRVMEELRENPAQAIDRLKGEIDIIDKLPDLSPDVRADLRGRLESALMSSRQRQQDFDSAMAARQRNEAIALEHQRMLDDVERKEEKVSRLINRFNSLLVEGNFKAAEEVTLEALRLQPDLPESNAAYESARLAYNAEREIELRRMREVSFLEAMYRSELAAATFVGEPPLIFPDAETWARKKAQRAKYQDVRLAGSENDEKILRTLEEPCGDNFSFDGSQFSDVMNQLKNEFGINVILDPSAEDGDLTPETEVTFSAVNIRLKNALKLLLKKYNATYIVRDEVLSIISLDAASDPAYFVTNIYNVGDLVAPRRAGGGGMGMGGMGGGMGGMGGGMGGMGGGMGGMGGGMGGMGGGGGPMGGGIFCIQDKVTQEAANSEPVSTGRAKSKRPTAIKLSASQSWSEYFAANFADPADVRETVRDMMNESRPEGVVELVNAAIAHNQVQPWMYEAMVLAMQIANRPAGDIERALMSAIDFSSNAADAMIVVDYMARNGMEKRAIRLLMDLAEQNPGSVEPYVLGLRAAQRIEDEDGIRWATSHILSEAWPNNRHIVKEAVVAAKALQARMEKAGRTTDLNQFRKELDEVLQRDCIIEVSWTGDADLDLYVEEPGGSVCSRVNPRSIGGGYLMGDEYSKSASNNGQTTEYYVLPKGFSGDYRLLVRRVWGQVTSGKATVTIRQNFGTEKETSETRQVNVGDKGSLVLFNLPNGRRAEPLEQVALATAVQEQFVVNRSVLAQQLDSRHSRSASASYYRSRYGEMAGGGGQLGGGGLNGPVAGPFAGRNVGYMPVISTIPSGAMFNVNHATTADRMYVLISTLPFFTQVTEVTTFTVAQGGGGGIGGLGGGGLGGGGLGGGGLGGGGLGGGGLF